MRTNKERQQLIYRRTLELRCKERRKKQCMFSACGVALCLMLVIGIGSFMPGVVKQASVGNIDYTMGTASMLGHYEALGYICMGVLAFALGVCVTVLLYRLRRVEEHKRRTRKRTEMNFEIIDNVFQVAVFFAAALGDMVYWFYKRDRLYIILALVHSCFMMGTLYFVLHLVIRGVVPQVFYVSEISWIASYLFMHTYQIVRYRIKKIRIAKIPVICGAGVLIASMWSGIFGPVFLTTGIFAMVAGVIVFIAVFRILYEKEPHGVCYCMIVCVVLEVALYVSSNFIHDYTKFNLYFLIDFVLTIVNMLLLPCTVWEVSRDDVY